jgi:hypothetical protein
MFTVTGVDSRPGAQSVFVWRRLESEPKFALLGSGAIANEQDGESPPGTFAVTVMLPFGCRSQDVVVTDNVASEDFIADVLLTPADAVSGFRRTVQVAPPRS